MSMPLNFGSMIGVFNGGAGVKRIAEHEGNTRSRSCATVGAQGHWPSYGP